MIEQENPKESENAQESAPLPEAENQPGILRTNPKPEQPHSKSVLILIIAVVLSSFLGGLFGFMGGGIANKLVNNPDPKNDVNSEGARQTVIEEESATIDVVEHSSPAVVSIVITKDVPKYRNMFNDPFGFFSPYDSGDGSSGSAPTEKKKIGGGSGFIATENGMIVTNRHVVDDTTADYTVMTSDGKEYPATVLARDPVRDVAVIKIEGSGFSVLEMGDSGSLKIGQTVIAIGNSLGEFSNSVSKGIISGLKREVTAGSGYGDEERLTGIIQTDAAINPGNSGGPLLDINGKVIGVNVAMAQGAENVGFALPINQVKKIVEQVKTSGKISTPYIGVRYVIITEEIQKENKLPFDYGVLVVRGERMSDLAVIPNSPADKAGIMENDIILSINGEKITAQNQLADIISEYNVGDVVSASVWQKGETKDISVTLEERQ